jgi:hypothetical protein
MHPLSFNQVFVSAMSGSISIISSLVDSLVDLFTGLVLWLASHRIENHNPYLYPIGVCSYACRSAMGSRAVAYCSVARIAITSAVPLPRPAAA